MVDFSDVQLDRAFAALADPTRRAILDHKQRAGGDADRRTVRRVAAGGDQASRRAGASRPDRALQDRALRALPPAGGCAGEVCRGGPTLTKPSLTLKRRLKASPAQVFSAWADLEKIVRWFGPAETSGSSFRW